MKKLISLIFALMFISLTGCSGKNNKNDINSYYTFDDSESDIAAVLFLGCTEDDYENSKKILNERYFKGLGDNWIDSLEKVQTESWQEIYLIIPKYKDEIITIVELNEADSEPVSEKELITTQNPVLLRCNFSDIVPSSRITIKYQGQEIKFSPYISLKDGSIVTADSIYTENIVSFT